MDITGWPSEGAGSKYRRVPQAQQHTGGANAVGAVLPLAGPCQGHTQQTSQECNWYGQKTPVGLAELRMYQVGLDITHTKLQLGAGTAQKRPMRSLDHT